MIVESRFVTFGASPCGAYTTIFRGKAMLVDTGRVMRLIDALLGQPSRGNGVWSPVGFCNGLAMAREASAGRTRAEFDAMLPEGPWLSGEASRVNPLRTANMILTTSASVRPDFADRLVERADARVFDIGSSGGREAAGRWASERTGRVIQVDAYVPPVAMPDVVTLISVNKLDIRWQSPFDAAGTHPREFHLADGSLSTVQMMHMKSSLPYFDRQYGETVMLDLRAGLEAYFVLPKPGCNPTEAARETVSGLLQAGLQPSTETMDLYLPRFTVRSEGEARRALRTLGVTAAFTPGQADLTAGFSLPHLHLGPVSHSASISVDENGVRAESDLSIPRSLRVERKTLRLVFDRPFAMVLWDPRRRTIPFLACIADPGPVD